MRQFYLWWTDSKPSLSFEQTLDYYGEFLRAEQRDLLDEVNVDHGGEG